MSSVGSDSGGWRPPERLRDLSGGRRRRFGDFFRSFGVRAARAALALVLVAFAVFLAFQLRDGFERRAKVLEAPARDAEALSEEASEVVSRGIELTQFDDRGRPLVRITAAEALGRSDDTQHFTGVEVRVFEIVGGQDAVIAADELLLNTSIESFEFLGNALLVAEGLELSGPRLQFRRVPDRLWSTDPVQFQTENFFGIAASLQFRLDSGDVVLSGVVAEPVDRDGFSAIAERARFDRATAETRLFGDVEIASEQFRLASDESVVLRRDPERDWMRSVLAGFGTVLHTLPPPGEAAGSEEPENGPGVRFFGDEVEIELDAGRTPRIVRFLSDPVVEAGENELRGERGQLELDADGKSERLRLFGEVTSRLVAGAESEFRIAIQSETLEVRFDEQGEVSEARYQGRVAARYGGASASAEEADWNGEDTLTFRGSPHVVDESLLELESRDLRLIVGELGRVEAEGAVTARFLPDQVRWLPGEFDEAAVASDAATLESGTGRGVFTGGVRLLFGPNRLVSELLEVDAGARSLLAEEGVESSLEFAGAAAEERGATAASEAAEDSSGAGERSLRFDAWARRFTYDAAGSRLSYSGAPRLEQRSESGELSRVSAGSIETQLLPDGSVGAVIGELAARFERGSSRVEGQRIRYEPDGDRIEAWGRPAVVAVDGRFSEGGHLALDFRREYSEIGPTPGRRAVTRVEVRRPAAPGPS